MLTFKRENSAVSFKKNKKESLIEQQQKRLYHTREDNCIKIHDKISMKIIELPGGKYNGLRRRYHLHFDHQLGAGKATIRRIPCGCKSCIKIKHIAWDKNITNLADQRIFAHNVKFKYINVLIR